MLFEEEEEEEEEDDAAADDDDNDYDDDDEEEDDDDDDGDCDGDVVFHLLTQHQEKSFGALHKLDEPTSRVRRRNWSLPSLVAKFHSEWEHIWNTVSLHPPAVPRT